MINHNFCRNPRSLGFFFTLIRAHPELVKDLEDSDRRLLSACILDPERLLDPIREGNKKLFSNIVRSLLKWIPDFFRNEERLVEKLLKIVNDFPKPFSNDRAKQSTKTEKEQAQAAWAKKRSEAAEILLNPLDCARARLSVGTETSQARAVNDVATWIAQHDWRVDKQGYAEMDLSSSRDGSYYSRDYDLRKITQMPGGGSTVQKSLAQAYSEGNLEASVLVALSKDHDVSSDLVGPLVDQMLSPSEQGGWQGLLGSDNPALNWTYHILGEIGLRWAEGEVTLTTLMELLPRHPVCLEVLPALFLRVDSDQQETLASELWDKAAYDEQLFSWLEKWLEKWLEQNWRSHSQDHNFPSWVKKLLHFSDPSNKKFAELYAPKTKVTVTKLFLGWVHSSPSPSLNQNRQPIGEAKLREPSFDALTEADLRELAPPFIRRVGKTPSKLKPWEVKHAPIMASAQFRHVVQDVLQTEAPKVAEAVLSDLGEQYPGRARLKKLLTTHGHEKIDPVLDQCNDDLLSPLFRAVLEWVLSANEYRWRDQTGDILDSLFDTLQDQPASISRLLLKLIEISDLPVTVKMGIIYALGKLREPVGGKVPKTLGKIGKNERSDTQLRDVAKAQKHLFDQSNINKGKHRSSVRRVQEARESLRRGHKRACGVSREDS